MDADAIYTHPFESSTRDQQERQVPAAAAPRPHTSHSVAPNETDWKLLALSASRSKQQQQTNVSAANLAKNRSSSALNPLSGARDIENTLAAAAAASERAQSCGGMDRH